MPYHAVRVSASTFRELRKIRAEIESTRIDFSKRNATMDDAINLCIASYKKLMQIPSQLLSNTLEE